MKSLSKRWLLVGWIGLVVLSACVGQGPRPALDSPATAEAVAAASRVTPTWSPLVPLPPILPSPTPSPQPSPTLGPPVRFAVIGDFGQAGPHEQAVAALVDSWHPDFVVTTGDNNYPNGAMAVMAANVLQYYGDDVEQRRFFPPLGNHDWRSGIEPHLAIFDLPGNERYYDVVWGPVHLLVLDSNWHEPGGIGANSKQAQWLRQRGALQWRLRCHAGGGRRLPHHFPVHQHLG
ncbi:MAG TPA: hypothetical protein G4O04_02560 [Anaerolineae bacterium]|nr:hypothetical protein [Anaerolineae bacterium]HIQ08664.1 hypothetical protein [Anaerolineaceae bacterium]